MNQDSRQYFDISKFMQFDVLKIMLCVMVLVILILPFMAIEFILYLTFGFYSAFLFKIILLLTFFEILIGINLSINKRKAKASHIDYTESLKTTWMLIKMLDVAVDSSKYNYSANHQRQVVQNVLRFSSYVLVLEKGTACIFVAEPLNIDARRNPENLNQISNNLAQYLRLTNSNFKNEIWRIKRWGMLRTEKYDVQQLYY